MKNKPGFFIRITVGVGTSRHLPNGIFGIRGKVKYFYEVDNEYVINADIFKESQKI